MAYDDGLSFLHYAPTRVVFGVGALSEAGLELDRLGVARAVIVTDAVIAEKTDLVTKLKASLGARCAGVYAGAIPDSGLHIVDAGAAYAREAGADSLVSLGGGSAIDTAKGMAVVLTEGGSLIDHQGFQNLTRPQTPHVSVPTTHGTGSEVTRYAVIKDHEERHKLLFGDFHLIPDVAILDPVLTVGMPSLIAAGTTLDALTHAIEGAHSLQRNPIADALAIHAVRLVRRWLPRAMSAPKDLAARGQLLLASTMAGTAFDNAQVGLVHAIAHSVGARHGVHHGLANAIALPHVIRFNAPDAASVYAELARAAGVTVSASDEEATEALAVDVAAVAKAAGLPSRYRDVGVPESDLEAIAELAITDGSIVYNPRMAMDPALVLEVLRAAW
ncbi:MAG: iron-containing alcohol dehydrogenase [Deltaproteobacteria bacterium]|nr:iron-containing alcohol dehydrogenase [Deltaproteobacteria bacterium]